MNIVTQLIHFDSLMFKLHRSNHSSSIFVTIKYLNYLKNSHPNFTKISLKITKEKRNYT